MCILLQGSYREQLESEETLPCTVDMNTPHTGPIGRMCSDDTHQQALSLDSTLTGLSPELRGLTCCF